MVPIIVLISVAYLGVCLYLLIRLFRALGYCGEKYKSLAFRIPATLVYAFFAFSPLIAFLLPKATDIRRIMQIIGSYWFGVLLYAVFFTVIAQIISILCRRVFKVLPRNLFRRKVNNSVCLILTIILVGTVCTYGAVNARNIKVNDYSVNIHKNIEGLESLNVVLISDLHIGYNVGVDHISQTVEKINAQNPDIVCIAGDIYDNDYDAIDNPDALAKELSKIKSTYGTYACWGNHDVDQIILGGFTFDTEPVIKHDSRMIDFLKKSNINILEDETVLIDNKFYVSGRVDGEKPATDNDIRKTPDELLKDVDKSKPVIMIYHEPDELQEISESGVDLLLCGHTHNGQLFPANILTSLGWENSYGYLQKDNMHNIVSSGIGVWGPFMRVGTDSEICNIKVSLT